MEDPFIAVLSDTHGMLRQEVLTDQLAGASLIIHAGDVGGVEILRRLKMIAPVKAVHGNVDSGLEDLPSKDMFQFEGKTFYLIHAIDQLDISPQSAGVDYLIYGHSHRPKLERKGDLVYLNPGSCGPKRMKLPVTMARIWLDDEEWEEEIIYLDKLYDL